MAITIVEERKTQKYLVIVFGAIILAIVFVLLSRFVKKEEIVVPSLDSQRPRHKIKIQFQILNNPVLDQLVEPFPEIPSMPSSEFKEMMGKENPFFLSSIEASGKEIAGE